MRKHSLALAIASVFVLVACGSGSGGDEKNNAGETPTPPAAVQPPTASVPDANQFFHRVATFPICAQIGASCESDEAVNAEIVTASPDGMTLIYTSGLNKTIGFVDIADPSRPVGLGAISVGGEPTSVSAVGAFALAAVNTSPSYIAPSGKLVVLDIVARQTVFELDLGGQPDSIAISKDGKYAAIAIENERDEDANNGDIPQLPAGSLAIIDLDGAPANWKKRTVELTGLASIGGTDPEPEYVSINDQNQAVVTMQENNHLVLVDLVTGRVTSHFSAGTATLQNVDTTDERPNLITLDKTLADVRREPDGVTWMTSNRFATANEGDYQGGSRSFTIFQTDGSVAYEAGAELEHRVARLGHTNDRRSDAKGSEPENVAFARYDKTDYLFVGSERSSIIAVYDMSQPATPVYKQALPAALSPEGLLTIASRGLMVSASEVDNRSAGARSALNIYRYQSGAPTYPTIQSADSAGGTPIPWAALSGLAAAPTGQTLYAVEDSFFRANRVLEIDASQTPALITRALPIVDTLDVLRDFGAALPPSADPQSFDQTDVTAMINADKTVNLDPEGIAVSSTGGFWIASEGAGSVSIYESGRPITSANLLLRLSAEGVIEQVIPLPAAFNALQTRYGFEGVTESDGKLIVAIQRPFAGENMPRIGVYDLTTQAWQFHFYPLDNATSPYEGWVGLSEITAIGNNRFLVVERDNRAGPDARIKRLYRIDLTGVANDGTVTKTLVRDLMGDLQATNGLTLEKVEGLAVLANGNAFAVTDNDGVNDHSGETQLLRLGRLGD